MTGQPPNLMSQSPERGLGRSLRSSEATNGRLAGAAAMLTDGIAAQTASPLAIRPTSRHAHCHSLTRARHLHASYSPAVKGFSPFSGANPALQRTAALAFSYRSAA